VLATGALSLFLVNLICVNLVGVMTFLAQGIRPATWWEKDRAAKAMRIVIPGGGIVDGIGQHDPAGGGLSRSMWFDHRQIVKTRRHSRRAYPETS
jgi:uncharacterized membrane protein